MKRRPSSTGRSPWPLMSTSWWWILECPEDACDLLHQVLGAHGHHPKEAQTWDLSKILHCRIFRPKILQSQFCLISSVLVIKTQRNEWKWRNLHCWQKFYTAAGMDKSHIWRGWLGVSLSTDWSPGPRFKLCHQVFVHLDGKKFSTHLLTLLSSHLPCQLSPASWNLTPKRKLRMRMQMQMQVTFSNHGKLLVVGIKLMTKPPECRQGSRLKHC